MCPAFLQFSFRCIMQSYRQTCISAHCAPTLNAHAADIEQQMRRAKHWPLCLIGMTLGVNHSMGLTGRTTNRPLLCRPPACACVAGHYLPLKV